MSDATGVSVRWADLSGQRFGRLTVLTLAPRPDGAKDKFRRYLCRCDCATNVVVISARLRRGSVKSCGCLSRETQRTRNLQHGGHGSPEYRSYRHMLSRCLNPNVPSFKNYGGRGITVCDRWRHDFAAFLADMGPKPSPAHSIERKDNDGAYSPANCRWATTQEQNRNTRSNAFVLYNGQRMTLAEAGERSGLGAPVLSVRLRRGWREDELFLPVDVHRKRPRRRN